MTNLKPFDLSTQPKANLDLVSSATNTISIMKLKQQDYITILRICTLEKVFPQNTM